MAAGRYGQVTVMNRSNKEGNTLGGIYSGRYRQVTAIYR